MKQTIKFNVALDITFHEYDSRTKNRRAASHIKRWIKDTLDSHCSFIPIYVERDENGSYIEDCTRKSKIKVEKL